MGLLQLYAEMLESASIATPVFIRRHTIDNAR